MMATGSYRRLARAAPVTPPQRYSPAFLACPPFFIEEVFMRLLLLVLLGYARFCR